MERCDRCQLEYHIMLMSNIRLMMNLDYDNPEHSMHNGNLELCPGCREELRLTILKWWTSGATAAWKDEIGGAGDLTPTRRSGPERLRW